ncbi:hypothetical protein ACOSQ3_028716 [Xanthoceras sorbifolium]
MLEVAVSLPLLIFGTSSSWNPKYARRCPCKEWFPRLSDQYSLKEIILCFKIFQLQPFKLRLLRTCQHNTFRRFCYYRDNNRPILFGPQEVLHEHATMIIVTIKAWNGWLYKHFRSNRLLLLQKGMK